MQHTPNFHLPQWDESDRVLRSDFNSAMANIEDGLSSSAAKDQELDEKITGVELVTSQSLTSNVNTLRSELQERLYRAAYQSYSCAASASVKPWQTSGFQQRFDGSEPSGNVSGLKQDAHCCWMGCSAGSLTNDTFKGSVNIIQELYAPKGNLDASVPLIAELTAADSCQLTTVFLPVKFDSIITREFIVSTTVTDAESGAVLTTNRASLKPTHATGRLTIPCKFQVRRGHVYRIVSTPLSAAPENAVISDPDGTGSTFIVEPISMPSGSVSKTFTNEEATKGALVLVRYASAGTGAAFSLKWGSQTFAPVKIRNITVDGRELQEAEFRRNASLGTAHTVELHIACNPGGMIELYNWGALFI